MEDMAMKNRKTMTILIFMLALLFIAPAWDTAFSAGKIKSTGKLTAVEGKGNSTNVIIDKYVYAVGKSARIIDQHKKPVSLRSFKLPVRVDFKYTYTPGGPVIILIEELPDVVPK
jgi:hypothetical protein